MLFVLLLYAASLLHALPILLARRTIYTSTVLRRSEPARFERGVFVVQFRSVIDTTILRRLQAVLDYEPTEYVPTNALVLYINSTETGARLDAALGTRIKHFEKLQRDDRRTNIAEAVDNMRSRPINQEQRATRAGERGAAAQVVDQQQVRLRVRSFYASQREHIDDVDRANRYIAQLSNSMAALSSRPTPHVDDTAHHITIENIDIDEADMASEAILDSLADVYFIDVEKPYELLNYWGVPATHRAADAERTVSPAATQSRWQPVLGLRGANQIVGLSDTGIEYNCFFSDGLGTRGGSFPTITGLDRVPGDTHHRKIRAYSSGVGGDLRDAGKSSGHGTHVAGTLAGRAANGTSSAKYNGGAPDARIAFIDLMPSNTNLPYLLVPDMSTMMQWFFDAGARIKSASWGSNNNGRYTIDDRDLDAFVWREREMLVVFAAGNLGTEGSISTPAMNKNGLTVGASMNGYDAYALATVPSRSFAATTASWLASFSSRGSEALPFRKPDIIAPGGQYVWSADNDAPLSGSCADEAATTTGYAGTSMATPLAAAAAALLYEALQTNKVPIPATAGALPVRASLVRALLAASGRPLSGIYPSKPYASQTTRRNAEGFGRIALDRIVGPTVSLAILSNERAEHGLSRVGSSIRACIDISGLAQNATLAGFELVVQLAYADYPSSVSGVASLVNNVDLIVKPIGGSTPYAVNYNAVNVGEVRSTLERVIVAAARAVTVEVKLTQLGFGEVQTFSLIAALRAIAPSSVNITRSLVVSPLSTDVGQCVVCGDNTLKLSSQCARCGDGVLQTGEECESASGACCNTTTCRWRASGVCTIDAGACIVTGTCAHRNGTCVLADGGSLNHACEPTNVTTTAVCTSTAATWFSTLRAGGLPSSLRQVNSSELRICCQQFQRFAFDDAPADPLYHSLAKQYIAARLNFATPNVSTSSAVLTAIGSAKAILEARCGVLGLAFSADRTRTLTLISTLTAYNEPSCAVQNQQVVPRESWCSASIASQDLSVCGAESNQYTAANATCKCAALRQSEPDCSHLACSGRGASILDSVTRQDRCVCYPGWSGSACDRCADSSVAGTRFICIGATTAAQASGSPRYLLRSVPIVSVADRLNGSFYSALLKRLGKPAVTKTADSLPGSGALDCWCQTNRAAASTYESHAAAAQNASATLMLQMQWLAVFDSAYSITTQPARTASAFKIGGAESAGIEAMVIAVALSAIAVLQ